MENREDKVKTIQIEYQKDTATISYFDGDDVIGKPVSFNPVPKHLNFLLEKSPFPTKDVESGSDKASRTSIGDAESSSSSDSNEPK